MASFPLIPEPAANAAAGIGLMLAGIGLFALNDALGKWLLTTYSVGELLLDPQYRGTGPAGAVHPRGGMDRLHGGAAAGTADRAA